MRKNLASNHLAIATLALVCLVLLLAKPMPSPSNCSELYTADKLIKIDSQTLKAQEATTPAQQEKGLGGKACIGPDQGMLFIFDKSDYYQFWMKDMMFPIDIIWINDQKKIIQINQNVSPNTYPQNFSTAQPVRYVLEVKANQASKLGMSNGSILGF